jgi:uncharacterized protein
VRVQTIELDLPPLVAAFGRRLHDAGVPVTAERAERFASALSVVRPVARRRLYWTARAVFVSEPSQVVAFDRVFREVFGRPAEPEPPLDVAHRLQEVPADDQPADVPAQGGEPREQLVPVLASDEEQLRRKRFDELEPDELAAMMRLMARLRIATPTRRTRRPRDDRHGERIDLRRTLRSSLRTGGDPARLARRRRRILPRRLVLLCDISGSMEPYARVYLQFLTCAAIGSRPAGRVEAFAFATRLTRLTRALHTRSPERAIQRAAAAAPDWSSGTRIGEALKAFNDRHGRRGIARGAVVVILSDGWERGDPALVGREMQRLARLAHRIVWVNPRSAADGFSPSTGGMAAALPHCDALVSGHTLAALDEVLEAISAQRSSSGRATPAVVKPAAAVADAEPWASATPVAGSSVAMPSGYGPSRGRTTPGWSLGS